MTIKAIETSYKGYRFRSRLEARWATFFDTLGLKWEYEPEGFDLDGTWYLPDFYLPTLRNIQWLDIKPLIGSLDDWPSHLVFDKHPSCEKHDTCDHLAHRFALLVGQPYMEVKDTKYSYTSKSGYTTTYTLAEKEFEYNCYIFGDNDYRWCECTNCGQIGLEYHGQSQRLCGCDSEYRGGEDTPRLMAAYTAARSARFGKGGRG